MPKQLEGSVDDGSGRSEGEDDFVVKDEDDAFWEVEETSPAPKTLPQLLIKTRKPTCYVYDRLTKLLQVVLRLSFGSLRLTRLDHRQNDSLLNRNPFRPASPPLLPSS